MSQVWTFTVEDLPPGVNHMYRLTQNPGGKALTTEAKRIRRQFSDAAFLAGFEARGAPACYAVWVTFTMPGWSMDIDSPLKALLDSVFGSRADHRIVKLSVLKRVKRGERATEVVIQEVEAL